MRKTLAIAGLGLLASIATAPVLAAALLPPPRDAVMADAPGPWQVRLRALGVVTRDKGSVNGIPGSDLSYSDRVIPELDISYYFTDNIAAELILGTAKANVNADGSIAALGKAGSVWVLPPTLTLQYHFTNFGAFRPYLGAGVNYTVFYSQDSAGPFTDLDVDNQFGAALQIGFDYMLNDNWGVNLDAKKVFLRPDWSARLGDQELSGKAKLDPWLIGTGITYRF